jgi:hypothetical protein
MYFFEIIIISWLLLFGCSGVVLLAFPFSEHFCGMLQLPDCFHFASGFAATDFVFFKFRRPAGFLPVELTRISCELPPL